MQIYVYINICSLAIATSIYAIITVYKQEEKTPLTSRHELTSEILSKLLDLVLFKQIL